LNKKLIEAGNKYVKLEDVGEYSEKQLDIMPSIQIIEILKKKDNTITDLEAEIERMSQRVRHLEDASKKENLRNIKKLEEF
jgi:hypothetical protein